MREKTIYLSANQIDDILNDIVVPFDSISEVVALNQKQIRDTTKIHLKKNAIYPSKIAKLKRIIKVQFAQTLIQPKIPIGPISADAIGQQATQTNLNTFHQTGSAKNGGTDGIRECISISKNRKIEYSTIHFKNESLTFNEVMDYKRKFIGVSIATLATSIKLKPIYLTKYLTKPQQKDDEADWWYRFANLDGLYMVNENNQIIEGKRSCIRLKFDIQKLYEYQITTQKIAEIIESAKFKIKPNKSSKAVEHNVKCICSPTIFGTIDVYMLRSDTEYDHYLSSILQFEEFALLFVSGIPGITNFYAIKSSVTSLIRDGEKIDDKLHIYMNDNRFKGIPFFRMVKIIEAAGYELDESMHKNTFIDTLFDYNPANPMDIREEIIVSSSLYRPFVSHSYYTVEQIEQNKWKLRLNLPYINSGYVFYSVDSLIKYEFKDMKIVSSIKAEPISSLIINTKDDYDTFMKNINNPVTNLIKNGKMEGNRKSVNALIDILNRLNYGVQISDLPIPSNQEDLPNHAERYSATIVATDTDYMDKIKKAEDEYYKYYIYAETSGADLKPTLLNSLVNRRKTWCNNYYQIFNIFGIEALRNFLAFDLKNMINNSGYINAKFLELAADVMTYAGINPMTSEGILCHGRGSLAYATFDKVIQHLYKAMLIGKKESTDSTSISIILGKPIKLGTGGFLINKDESKLSLLHPPRHNDKYDHDEDVNRLDIMDPMIYHGRNGMVGSDTYNNGPLLDIKTIKSGKLKMLPWIYNRVIIKDIRYFMLEGIDKLVKMSRSKPVHMVSINQYKLTFPMYKKFKITPKL